MDAGILKEGIDVLKDKGFTEAMTLAFLNTAKETNTIVSSRVPGKACTELIDQGYDLKGFQIKSKSCDWGPMAGFLCQLPFFNKAGFSKIAYNAGYIAVYLEGIDGFDGTKKTIDELNLAISQIKSAVVETLETPVPTNEQELYNAVINKVFRFFNEDYQKLSKTNVYVLSDDEIAGILDNLGIPKIKAYLNTEKNKASANKKPLAAPDIVVKGRGYIIDKALEPLSLKIGAEVIKYKNAEQKAGKWSGENTLPSKSPFVQLKRKFIETGASLQNPEAAQAVKEALSQMPGVVELAICVESLTAVVGTAYNKLAKDGNDKDATVKVDFLVQRDVANPLLWSVYHGAIFFRSPVTEEEPTPKEWVEYKSFGGYTKKDALLKKLGIDPEDYPQVDYVNDVFSRCTTDKVEYLKKIYYPVCGIMNPHPPYKDTPGLYKNAVSGDYDLFAFWPSVQLPKSDTTRAAEILLNQPLKVAYPNPLFCIDFIPGFSEIDKNESPETGNYNYLGQLVAMMLNSHANDLSARLNAGTKANPNRAFHSDEGGRPGIIEIEFPIAVFFPAKTKTAVLGKSGSDTVGGVVSNITDFLQLLLDINQSIDKDPKKFRIIIHSDWMTHLFYLTLTTAKQKSLSDDMTSPLSQQDKLSDKALKGRKKEFLEIDEHTEKDGGYKLDDLTDRLKALLFDKPKGDKLDTKDQASFEKLQSTFLGFAFIKDKKAVAKRMEIEEIVYKKYIETSL